MNGAHDLGGMHGFGPVDPEPEALEPPFHAEWERRVFAVTLACGAFGRWSLDASRHARERQHPRQYLANSYYETWLAGLETLLVETGIVTPEELETGKAAGPAPDELAERKLAAERVPAALARGGPADMEPAAPPRFQAGDRVRVGNINTPGHTRAVRYARNHVGVVETHHGCHVFADRSAHGEKMGEHLYGVRFTARELWGEAASPRDTVRIDLWEPHLEPAE